MKFVGAALNWTASQSWKTLFSNCHTKKGRQKLQRLLEHFRNFQILYWPLSAEPRVSAATCRQCHPSIVTVQRASQVAWRVRRFAWL